MTPSDRRHRLIKCPGSVRMSGERPEDVKAYWPVEREGDEPRNRDFGRLIAPYIHAAENAFKIPLEKIDSRLNPGSWCAWCTAGHCARRKLTASAAEQVIGALQGMESIGEARDRFMLGREPWSNVVKREIKPEDKTHD